MPGRAALTFSTADAHPPAPVEAAAIVRRLRDRTGLPLLCVESETGTLCACDGSEPPPFIPDALRSRLAALTDAACFPIASGLLCYAVPLPTSAGRFVAFGYQLRDRSPAPIDIVLAAARAGWSQVRLHRWTAEHPHCPPGPLLALLRLALAEMHAERRTEVERARIEQLTAHLDHAYEEVSLFHALTRNLQVSRRPADLVALCFNRLPALVDAQAHLIRLATPGEEPRTWCRGTPPFPPEDLQHLLERFGAHDWSRPLVKNHLADSPLSTEFPRLKNFVAVPIREGRHAFGWIVSANVADGREFGTVEAGFLNTIATILGTHVRNIDLLREQDGLLLGFVKSFVSTLDAKDPYTRGHSERVALIARRIGKELGLSDEDLRTIHLSGLLHDVGKIGIDDRILRKAGPLTDDEFAQVQRHPMIGFNILSGLRHLQDVLPGIRNHHENFDGSGYPDGLAGEAISPLARILAVADGYDAMSSDRPYRAGMPAERIDAIFREGAGRQWDPRVLDAYFRCREDVRLLCAAYSLEEGCPVEGAPRTTTP